MILKWSFNAKGRKSRRRAKTPQRPRQNNVGVMYGLLTFVTNLIMDFITDFYLVKVSNKVYNKVGNKSQYPIHDSSIRGNSKNEGHEENWAHAENSPMVGNPDDEQSKPSLVRSVRIIPYTLLSHSVEISVFFCHSNFTWNHDCRMHRM